MLSHFLKSLSMVLFVASTVYDSELAESSISLSFCIVNHIYTSHGACQCNTTTTVMVEISPGVFFTCVIRLGMIYKSLDRPYDVIPGRDRFKFCSTGLEDSPLMLRCACLH